VPQHQSLSTILSSCFLPPTVGTCELIDPSEPQQSRSSPGTDKNPAKTSGTNRAACAEYVNMLFVCTPYAVPQSHLRRNDVGGDYGAAFAPSAKFPWFSTRGRNPPNCAMVVYKRTQAFPFRHLHTFVVLWSRWPISSTYKLKLNRLGCRSLPLLGCPETCFRISKFSPQTTNLEGCNM
jgi:hypothetical protein